jgi:hypothetical protein
VRDWAKREKFANEAPVPTTPLERKQLAYLASTINFNMPASSHSNSRRAVLDSCLVSSLMVASCSWNK